MGIEEIYPKGIEQEGLLNEDSYSVISYRTEVLPKDYLPFIYSHWLHSMRFGNDYFRLIDSNSYYSSYNRYIAKILADHQTTVRLAVLTDDKDVVLGFSIVRGHLLDYVYVKKEQRHQKIGTNLVPPNIETISHVTKIGLSIWANKYKDWKFNPFL